MAGTFYDLPTRGAENANSLLTVSVHFTIASFFAVLRIMDKRVLVLSSIWWMLCAGAFGQEQGSEPSRADLAFEQGEWAAAIDAYREILAEDSLNGDAWLRIAQAQRELGQHGRALETLDRARVVGAREAMIELERARNLAVLAQPEAALRALDMANENGLRALSTLEEAADFSEIRSRDSFQRVYRAVRNRVFPCEASPASQDFDFWVGNWEVRLADGSLVGHSRVTRQDGGCTIVERWEGSGGSSGTGVNYFSPSRGRWRQVWAGSAGTFIDIAGGLEDGSMRLDGTIEYVSPEQVLAFRGIWTELSDGTVHQLLEQFDVNSGGWETWFEGFYRLRRLP